MFTPVSAPEPQMEARRAARGHGTGPDVPGRAGRVPRRAARRRQAGHNVDVFEELARLPEPLPLGDPSAPVPDSPRRARPTRSPTTRSRRNRSSACPSTVRPRTPSSWSTPGPTRSPPPPRSASPPTPRPSTWPCARAPTAGTSASTPDAPSPEPTGDATTWDTTGWQPPTPPADEHAAPTGFWEGTDDWAPVDAPGTERPTTGRTRQPTTPWLPEATPVEVLATETVVDPAIDSPFVADWHPDAVDRARTRAGPRRPQPVDGRRVAARALRRRGPVGTRARPGSGEHRLLRRLGHPGDDAAHRRHGDHRRAAGVGHHPRVGDRPRRGTPPRVGRPPTFPDTAPAWDHFRP